VSAELRFTLAHARFESGAKASACKLAAEAEAEFMNVGLPPMVDTASQWRTKHCGVRPAVPSPP
jgi:hypothetical protein